MKPALALSLHTTKPALREQLLPHAPRLTPSELVDAGERLGASWRTGSARCPCRR